VQDQRASMEIQVSLDHVDPKVSLVDLGQRENQDRLEEQAHRVWLVKRVDQGSKERREALVKREFREGLVNKEEKAQEVDLVPEVNVVMLVAKENQDLMVTRVNLESKESLVLQEEMEEGDFLVQTEQMAKLVQMEREAHLDHGVSEEFLEAEDLLVILAWPEDLVHEVSMVQRVKEGRLEGTERTVKLETLELKVAKENLVNPVHKVLGVNQDSLAHQATQELWVQRVT